MQASRRCISERGVRLDGRQIVKQESATTPNRHLHTELRTLKHTKDIGISLSRHRSGTKALPLTQSLVTPVKRASRIAVAVTIAVLLITAACSIGTADAAASDFNYAGGTFVDDDGSVHEGSIEALVAMGVIHGCADDLYCPTRPVNWAELAMLLDRMLQLPASDQDYFDDDDGSFFEDAINSARHAGIVDGCGPNSYCPNEPVTRARLADVIVRAVTGISPLMVRDYFTDDDGSRYEPSINALAAHGITKGCSHILFCPDGIVNRGQAASFLARAFEVFPISLPDISWRLEVVIDGISGGTTDLQAPTGDDRLFLVTRDGLIRIINDGEFNDVPFLDLTASVMTEGSSERGMLGLAFHPQYRRNGRFFVFFTSLDGHSRVYEYRVSDNPDLADTESARLIITLEQRPTSPVHKGGQLQFGPDGYLYVAVGDGGGFADPFRHGQNSHTELGTILRLDVDRSPTAESEDNDTDHSGEDTALSYVIPSDNPFADGIDGLPEVWAYGLRNPWRFSFDDGSIYIGDVGEESWEEVNIADASVGGLNYGWNEMEGLHCFVVRCDPSGLVAPAVDYSRDHGVSVIGGYVYRGSEIPEMTGHYFYADFAGRWIRTLRYADGEVADHFDWSKVVADIPRYTWSFGRDGHGEIYVLGRWSVLKIVPAEGS